MLEKVLLSFCLLSTAVVNGFFVTLDAHAEECFFDKVTAGTKLGNLFSLSFSICNIKRMILPGSRINLRGC